MVRYIIFSILLSWWNDSGSEGFQTFKGFNQNLIVHGSMHCGRDQQMSFIPIHPAKRRSKQCRDGGICNAGGYFVDGVIGGRGDQVGIEGVGITQMLSLITQLGDDRSVGTPGQGVFSNIAKGVTARKGGYFSPMTS